MISSVRFPLLASSLLQAAQFAAAADIITIYSNNTRISYTGDAQQQKCQDTTYSFKVAQFALLLVNTTSSGGLKFRLSEPPAKAECNSNEFLQIEVHLNNQKISPTTNLSKRYNQSSDNSEPKTVGSYKYNGANGQQSLSITLLPPPGPESTIHFYQLHLEEGSPISPINSPTTPPSTDSTPHQTANVPTFNSLSPTSTLSASLSQTNTPSPSFSSGLANSTSSTSVAHAAGHSSGALAIGLGTSLPLLLIAFLACFFLCRKSRRKIEFNPSDMDGRPIDASPFPSEKQDRYLFIPRSFLPPYAKSRSQFSTPLGPQSPRNSLMDISGSEVTVMQKQEETQPFETVSNAASHHSTLSKLVQLGEDEALVLWLWEALVEELPYEIVLTA
ncbi:hypothetical protein CPB83DRAFT_889118 [Crepidotus variabilis]|uniref:Uncharacterized protein n=1 Tax=Crepidotus variabilis TaxID=179855 RepID=A0A9P6JWZ3_9AGAR|nr:hypothetical protein CPB83DRAFT_889118 [Crepidotus variabilis]